MRTYVAYDRKTGEYSVIVYQGLVPHSGITKRV